MIEPGVYRYPRMDRVAFGRPWEQVLAEEVERLGASGVFAIAGSTLAATVPLAAAMREALGERLAGFTTGIRAHTPRDDVIAAAAKAREAQADLIVTIGGGSVTDAGKMVLLCLAADATEPQALDGLRPGGPALERLQALPVRTVAIPTTLSGGEFTPIAGCTGCDAGWRGRGGTSRGRQRGAGCSAAAAERGARSGRRGARWRCARRGEVGTARATWEGPRAARSGGGGQAEGGRAGRRRG